MYFFISGNSKRENIRRSLFFEKGQASVEAAVLIPIVLLLLMLLIQPAIILFDRIVMKNAATEGCRLLSTKTAVLSEGTDPYEQYILARLSSIPEEDHFHVHKGGCSWNITLSGDESSSLVSVCIRNYVKPLPLIGFFAGSLGATNEQGFFEIEVKAEFSPKNDWVFSNEAGKNPENWVKQWE